MADDGSDLLFPNNDAANNIFSLPNGQQLDDGSLLDSSSFGMTGNDAVVADNPEDFLLANGGEGDFCASSTSSFLPIDDEAGLGTGIVARGKSCRNPDTAGAGAGTGAGAGANPGAGASNLDSIFTPDDERDRTVPEIDEYWCSENRLQFKGIIPVCSIDYILEIYVRDLPATLSECSVVITIDHYYEPYYCITHITYIICVIHLSPFTPPFFLFSLLLFFPFNINPHFSLSLTDSLVTPFNYLSCPDAWAFCCEQWAHDVYSDQRWPWVVSFAFS